MDKRPTKRMVLLACMAILFLYVSCSGASVQAASEEYIRVGLTELYKEVSSITIENSTIQIGYCLQNSYQIDVTMNSSGGFTVTPSKSAVYSSDISYTSYEEAEQIAASLRVLGANAYVGYEARQVFRIYVVYDSSTKESQYTKIQGVNGITYRESAANRQRYVIKGSNQTIVIDGSNTQAFPQIQATENQVIKLGKRQYRDRIEIGTYNKESLTAINVIQMEHYLYGVVPCEVSSAWPEEVLKAQAVCARGFALSIAGYESDSNMSTPYHIGDTTSSQVYRGYTAEKDSTTKAVDATKGKVIKKNQEVITSYFFSTSGGSTEAVEDVWTTPKSYLRAVPDLEETSPAKQPWVITYTENELRSSLMQKGYTMDTIQTIFSEITTSSERVYQLRIQGKKEVVTLQKEAIRSILSLPSTKFKIVEYGDIPDEVSIKTASGMETMEISNTYIKNGNYQVQKANKNAEQYLVKSATNITNFPNIVPKDKNTYLFAGQGYGHGIGMSQSGAKGMAEAGYTYEQILQHYFTGTTIE